MANYTRGNNTNIIVGAAALFVTSNTTALTASTVPAFVGGESYRDTLTARNTSAFNNVGYTNNGIELSFAPDFGEVMVDQLLDTAKIFKQGMKVTLKTTLAEATLENLLLAIAGKPSDFGTANLYTVSEATYLANLTTGAGSTVGTVLPTTGGSVQAAAVYDKVLNLTSGDLGDYPIERGIIAIGPGIGNKDGLDADSPSLADQAERIYIAYRAVSITQVNVSAKRDSATAFDVEFRLLPDNNGSYGKIVDRTF